VSVRLLQQGFAASLSHRTMHFLMVVTCTPFMQLDVHRAAAYVLTNLVSALQHDSLQPQPDSGRVQQLLSSAVHTNGGEGAPHRG
jgi:hypothetical protein